MRKSRLAFVSFLIFFSLAGAAYAGGQEDIRLHKNCKICGMDREVFGYSRILIEYNDGTTVGTCSTRCAALDLALNIGKVPKSIMVGDFNTRDLTDARKAYWVIGGNKEGTMSSRGKWAFGTKKDASDFIARNGGRRATFDEALKASFTDLYHDLKTFWESMKKRESEETD